MQRPARPPAGPNAAPARAPGPLLAVPQTREDVPPHADLRGSVRSSLAHDSPEPDSALTSTPGPRAAEGRRDSAGQGTAATCRRTRRERASDTARGGSSQAWTRPSARSRGGSAGGRSSSRPRQASGQRLPAGVLATEGPEGAQELGMLCIVTWAETTEGAHLSELPGLRPSDLRISRCVQHTSNKKTAD